MTAKELSVFIIGLLLVGFLYLMKHPLNQGDTLTITNDKPIGLGILADDQINNFNPDTKPAEFATILDIPAWKLDIEELKNQTSDELLTSIRKAIDEERFFQPSQDNALFYLVSLKSIDDDMSKYQSIEEKLVQRLGILAQVAIAKNDEQQLTTYLSKLKTLSSENELIKPLKQQLVTIKTINKLYKKGIQQLSNNRIVTLDSQDAWHTAKQCLEIAGNNPKTKELITKINHAIISNALLAAEETDYTLAQNQIHQAELLSPESDVVLNAIEKITQLKQQRYIWLEQQISQAIDHVNIPRAKRMLEQLANLGLQSSQLLEYQNEINRIKTFGKHRPLQEFSHQLTDDSKTPKMVVMPTGRYIMGNTDSVKFQQPAHIVNINYGFAVSQNEISVGQFKQFIQNSNYRTDADNKNSSRIYDARTGRLKNKRKTSWQNNYLGKKTEDNEPVIHVSWNDAQAYVKWLSSLTGKTYRLLSEAEFEYVLRAGTKSYYPWGIGSPKSVIENLTGKQDKFDKNSRIKWSKGFENYTDGYWGPAPVGNFIVNQFRLNDTAGNVMEWVDDCWHDSYVRAPTDGKAWINSGCQDHVIRGGSWSSGKSDFSSSHRFKAKSNFTDARLGFRIALDL